MMAERHVAADMSGRGVHASAVAIGGHGLLLVGPSRSGKSRLALALIAASRPWRPIVLVGDDRIQLSPSDNGLMARPHPRIAGFIERRGLGIVALPYRPAAPLAAIVALGMASASDIGPPDLPILPLADLDDAATAGTRVLRWWGTLRARRGPDRVSQRHH